jgi:hypothetical protein
LPPAELVVLAVRLAGLAPVGASSVGRAAQADQNPSLTR